MITYKKLCLFILTILTLSQCKLESSENLLQKNYISPNSVQFTDQGIFVTDDFDGYLQIDAVYSDEFGIYILKAGKPCEVTGECRNKHRIWCWNCCGCAFVYCKFRCKCVEWPFKGAP